MKTRNLSTAAVILGALAATIAACSAQSSGTPPRTTGTAGQTSSGGSGNASGTAGGTTGNPGTAGTFGSGTAGTVGSGTAGTFGTGAGGTFGTGVGGTFGTGVGGTVGSAGSAGGSAVMSCGSLTVSPADPTCCVAAGTAADVSIDDLEDMNNTIVAGGNRQGYWYSYKDAVGTTLMPATMPFPPSPGGHGGMYSAGISGMVFAATATVPAYAGVGFDFNNHFKKSCPYDASAYHGLSFWAKGTPFKVSIKIPATTPATPLSAGSCAAMCEDHYSKLVAPPPDGTTWGQITLTFAGDATFKQAGWGTVATFTPNNILAVQFQVDGTTTQTAPVAYNYAVDDVAFTP